MPPDLLDVRAQDGAAPRSLDLEVLALRALARVGLATQPGLAAFVAALGGNEGWPERWRDDGLVRRTLCRPPLGDGPTTELLSLAPKGAKALSASAGKTVAATPTSRLRSGQKLLHDAGTGDALLAFLALAASGQMKLSAATTDALLLGTSAVLPGPPPRRVPLQPDAYVRWQTASGQRGLLIEYDRATVGLARMGRKYAGYLAWKRADGPERAFSVKALRVLTLVPDRRRLDKLREAALDGNGGKKTGFLLFALASDVLPADPGRLLQPVASVPGSDELEPIVSL